MIFNKNIFDFSSEVQIFSLAVCYVHTGNVWPDQERDENGFLIALSTQWTVAAQHRRMHS